ncbi:putative integral membrane protein [Acanthocheilonema viteae]
MSFVSHPSPNDAGVMKRMYEKFMKNPTIPILACVTFQMVLLIARKSFMTSMSQAEFSRSVALVPLAALAGTAVWYRGIKEQ